MQVRWEFRFYPTPAQEEVLSRTFGCCRFAYNRFLVEREAAWASGLRMGYSECSAALTKLKADPEYAWLREVSSVPVQQSLRHLDRAYRNFFAKRSRRPRFRTRRGRQAAEYTRSAFRFDTSNQRLKLAGLGWLKVRWSRHVGVNPSTVTVVRKPSGRTFVSLVVNVTPPPLPETGQVVGVDFGVLTLATLSTGEKVRNPRHLVRRQRHLAHLQRALARKTKGSKRREKCRRKVALTQERVADARKDTLSKLAWNLVTRYDLIFLEDLNLRGMAKNHSLARSLSDAGIGSAIHLIEAKAAMHGKTVVRIPRFFQSTRRCHACGHVLDDLSLSIRVWACPRCGARHDRDVNAAKNILAAGQAATAREGDVRPGWPLAHPGSPDEARTASA